MIIHHKGLTPEHWFKFSLAEQLANVGCENEYNTTDKCWQNYFYQYNDVNDGH